MPNRGLSCLFTEELTTADIEMFGPQSTCIDAVRLRVLSLSERREFSLMGFYLI